MECRIISPRQEKLLSLPMIKSHLRIAHSHHDEWLTYLGEVATDWVEENLGKTLLMQTRQVTHQNTEFSLPFGPVIHVKEVRFGKKVLSEEEYTLTPQADTLMITVPFRWKPTDLCVTYEAGYGNRAENVPFSLRHAVMGTLEYLYESEGDLKKLEAQTAPWLHAQRTYRLC